tara:strand:- start:6156 stop:6317 length:162 start_codon:yes stop_codon:yes gene_type:complete
LRAEDAVATAAGATELFRRAKLTPMRTHWRASASVGARLSMHGDDIDIACLSV